MVEMGKKMTLEGAAKKAFEVLGGIGDPIFDVQPQVVFRNEVKFDPIGNTKLGHAKIESTSEHHKLLLSKDRLGPHNLLLDAEGDLDNWQVD